MRVRLVGPLALMAMVLVSCGGASPEASGPSEGIQVHGDWTIEIYNEDGSLDESVEFSNALFDGDDFLAAALGHLVYPGTWGIEMFSPEGSQPCVAPTGDPASCLVLQSYPSIEGLEDSATSINLEVGAVDNVLTLSGSHVASAAGQIDAVKTTLLTCNQPLGAVDCSEAATDFLVFTLKSLDPSDVASVAAGQLIQVQVDISFTSG